jgi:TPR repeat protein/serine/threonine protein kinase
MTQWILSQGSCACDLVVPSDEANAPKRCSTCGKYLLQERKGSLTQWILRWDACTCGKDASSMPFQSAAPPSIDLSKFARSDETAEDGDPVIPLDPEQFPTERYAPIKELGRGATGAVYLCRDLLLSKKVAVKILHSVTAAQLIGFQEEARAVSKLDHPNVLKMLDFGPTNSGAPFMVMEYFNGITVEQLLEENGAIELGAAIEIFSDVCSALIAAHSLNIYHRDLTPSNILLAVNQSEEQRVKLIDFGLALVKPKYSDTTAFDGKALVGTPAYMAPDTVQSKAYDARSEIYSIGCVLFEVLTGQVPFRGENALETITMHANDAPPKLSEVAGQPYSNEIEKVIAKCLAKDPDKRFQSVADLQEALDLVAMREQKSGFMPSANLDAGVKRKGKFVPFVFAASIVAIAVSIPVAYLYVSNQKLQPKTEVEKSVAIEVDSPSSNASALTELQTSNQLIAKLQEAADKGDLDAQMQLGKCYMLGNGVTPDGVKAAKWFRKPAELGNVNAQSTLGLLYMKGQGVPKNLDEALKWYLKAAKQGDLDSQFVSGELYKAHKKDFPEAVKWLRLAADRGQPMAQSTLGTMMVMGMGTKKDPAGALALLRQSAAQGIPEACNTIGYMYETGIGLPMNHEEAMLWHKKAKELSLKAPARRRRAIETTLQQSGDSDTMIEDFEIQRKRGDLRAMFIIGMKKAQEPNYTEAMKWFKMAADLGDMNSQRILGAMYQTGRGVPKNAALALPWYEKAAVQGDPMAQRELASIYMKGVDVPKDPRRALKWLKRSADSGDLISQYTLAQFYARSRDGVDLKPDYKKALIYFKKAADFHTPTLDGMILHPMPGGESGYDITIRRMEKLSTQAKNNVGCMYDEGLGVPVNHEEALKWFTLAAQHGDTKGMENLGSYYENGKGVKKDFETALTWYKRSAALGSPNAELRLSQIYAGGIGGVPKDMRESQRLLRSAAEHGNPEAQKLLRAM